MNECFVYGGPVKIVELVDVESFDLHHVDGKFGRVCNHWVSFSIGKTFDLENAPKPEAFCACGYCRCCWSLLIGACWLVCGLLGRATEYGGLFCRRG